MLKAWPVAGSRRLGRTFLQMADEFVFGPPFDTNALEAVRGMKGQIDQKMLRRDQQARNVKLGTGGIREIELIVQSLQVRFGGRRAEVRHRNTLQALQRLCAASIISPEECAILTKAYLFLRDVENKPRWSTMPRPTRYLRRTRN